MSPLLAPLEVLRARRNATGTGNTRDEHEVKRATMMASGTYVSMTKGVPTLTDIAEAIARVPRFGGHCQVPWTVLDHSLFCLHMAVEDRQPAASQLALLLHDAHEALTGDIPTWFKTPDIRKVQHELDRRIMDAHYPWKFICYDDEKDTVIHYDRRALWAEARTVGPRNLRRMSDEEFVEVMGGKANPGDVALLQHNLLTGSLGGTEKARQIELYQAQVLRLSRQMSVDGLVMAQ